MNAYAINLQLFERAFDDDPWEAQNSKIRIITVAKSLEAASKFAAEAYKEADETEKDFAWQVVLGRTPAVQNWPGSENMKLSRLWQTVTGQRKRRLNIIRRKRYRRQLDALENVLSHQLITLPASAERREVNNALFKLRTMRTMAGV